MTPTNLNMLFQQLIPNFAHLVDTNKVTKDEFLDKVKSTYSLDNPKTNLFYQSVVNSTFETIRLNDNRDALLFNQ